MNPNFAAVDSEFLEHHWDAEEELPRKLPRPRGELVVTAALADASHAADKVTWRSHSGHVLFFHSKRQTAAETSAFSSEFIVMKHRIEDIGCLRFKPIILWAS